MEKFEKLFLDHEKSSDDQTSFQGLMSPSCLTKENPPPLIPEWASQYPDQPDLLPTDEYVLCSITMCLSPLEFALVPKELKDKIEDIERRLAQFDMNYNPEYIKKLYPGTPCYVNHKGLCRRAQVDNVGEDDAHLCIVDIGQTAYVMNHLIKPLPIELSQLAPSAYICSIRNVDSRELDLATQRRFSEVIQRHAFVAVQSHGRNSWRHRLLVDLFDSRLKSNISMEFQKKKTSSKHSNNKSVTRRM